MKQIYWKCVDCNSLINDSNMHTLGSDDPDVSVYGEFCYGCMSYNPRVVIAYA